MNDIKFYEIQRNPILIKTLLNVWEKSVRATHTFLSDNEISKIKEYVPLALNGVEHLAVAEVDPDKIVGFMGVQNNRLEMLFLLPSARGKGIGRKLLLYGIENYGVNELTVNEQNPQAVGFYRHMGFETYKRTALDDETEMDLSVERKPINLGDYSDRKINFLNKKKVKDKVVCSMFPKAEICSLLAEEKLTKPEKAVDMAIAILSPLVDMVKMSKQLNNLDNQYYMVTLESRKYLVLVTDEYVESRMLPEINTDKKFEIGNCQFINCGPIKTAD